MSVDPIQFLSPAQARHLDGDVSRSTETRRVKNGVWPPPVYDDNGHKSYVASEFYARLRRRAESRDKPKVERGISDPDPQAAKAARARRGHKVKPVIEREVLPSRVKMPVIGPNTGASSGNKL